MSLMQPSMIPALLEHMQSQFGNRNELLTFSVGGVFNKKEEHQELGLSLGQKKTGNMKQLPIVHLQVLLTDALQKIGYQPTIVASKVTAEYVHPVRTSDVIINEVVVGSIAELHPEVIVNMELPKRSAIATVNLQLLLNQAPAEIVAKKLTAYPAITYDETMQRTHNQDTSSLLTSLKQGSEFLESVEVIDTYQPEGATSYNLTLRFTYRSLQKTLTEQEVKPEHKNVMNSISE